MLPSICSERALATLCAALLLAAAVATASCYPPDYGPAPFACRNSPSCPEGYRCVHRVCRLPAAHDAGLPQDAPTWDFDAPGVDGLPLDQGGGCVNPKWVELPLPVPGIELERVWGNPAVGGLYALGAVDNGGSYTYHVLRRATLTASWSPYSASGIVDIPWDIWGTGSSDLHLIDSYQVRRYTGGVWKLAYNFPGDQFLNGIWISANTGPFVVDTAGSLYAFDRVAKIWKLSTTVAGGGLNAIWGPDGQGTQFYVGGVNGRIRSCTVAGTGTGGNVSCTAMPKTTNENIQRIYGTGAANVYAVGNSRTVLHYDGSKWSKAVIPSGPQSLYGVWGSGPNDLYAVGSAGTIMRSSGGAWTSMSSGTKALLTSVWGTGPRDVVVVGIGVMLKLSCQ